MSKKEKDMRLKIKTILCQQMELLAEASEGCIVERDLADISEAMCQVANAFKNFR